MLFSNVYFRLHPNKGIKKPTAITKYNVNIKLKFDRCNIKLKHF